MPDNTAVLTREYVPLELQDKPWVKDFLDKPWDKIVGGEFFKKLDGAESLIGKRPAIPDIKTAKPEELEKFFEQFRPEKPEEYEIPGAKDEKVDQGFIKAVQQGLHDGKISKVQSTKLLKAITEYGATRNKETAAAAAKKALEFDTLAKTMLGEQNKAVMERVKNLLKQYAPPVAQDALGKLTDEQVVVMGSIIEAIFKKYAPEDELNGKPGSENSGSGQASVEEKRAEMRKLMATKAASNWQDPEHTSTDAKVKQLAKEIAALSK